jgi:hypothetical protein
LNSLATPSFWRSTSFSLTNTLVRSDQLPIKGDVELMYLLFAGKISESEEMRPQWYDIVALPYSNMWLDDERWYPAMLDNRTFKAYYLFQGHDKIVEEKMEMTN